MLIKTMAELGENVEVNGGATWAALKPSIRAAEQTYILPLLGAAFYTELQTAYDGGPTGNLATLISLLQSAIAPLAMFLYVPRASVQITDGGIQRQETETAKSAYKYQQLQLQDSLLDAGLMAIENVLGYLNDHAGDFATWNTSAERTEANRLLIRSGRELKAFLVNLRQPERIYQFIRSMISNVEELTIAPSIGDDFETLKAKNLTGTGGAEEKSVIRMLKIALANYSMGKAMIDLQMRIDDSGVTLVGGRSDSTLGENSARTAADPLRAEARAAQYQSLGQQYISMANNYMNSKATAELFPARYALLQAEANQPILPSINAQISGAFSL